MDAPLVGSRPEWNTHGEKICCAHITGAQGFELLCHTVVKSGSQTNVSAGCQQTSPYIGDTFVM